MNSIYKIRIVSNTVSCLLASLQYHQTCFLPIRLKMCGDGWGRELGGLDGKCAPLPSPPNCLVNNNGCPISFIVENENPGLPCYSNT